MKPKKNINLNKTTRKSTQAVKSPTEAVDNSAKAMDSVPEKDTEQTMKDKICQSNSNKKLADDPWQMIPHVSLSRRKAAVGIKAKSQKTKGREITSLKKFLKMPNDAAKIPSTPLQKRKIVPLNSTTKTIPEIIRDVLKDYNSISFLTQPR
ncbi:MAG: hypothetical protein LBI77_02895 [Puniceicoccales bacterium]|nr:hypothetical protein [Puniceicoccales bacterium]